MARTQRPILVSLGVLFILGACSPTTSLQPTPIVSPAIARYTGRNTKQCSPGAASPYIDHCNRADPGSCTSQYRVVEQDA
jgi:hypothetical protein